MIAKRSIKKEKNIKVLKARLRETSNKNTVVKKVRKGEGRVTRLTEAMKDVIRRDKLRVGANNL